MREISPALARLAAIMALTDAEHRYLARIARPHRTVNAKGVIRVEGAEASHCYILLDGWVGSFTTSRDGHRVMTKIHMQGDLMGFGSLVFKETAETLVALSSANLVALSNDAIGSLFKKHSRLAALLYFLAQEDRVRQMDRTSSLLRLEAAGRIAALLLDLVDRQLRTQDNNAGFIPFYLTQYDIADLTGLTAVHTNRTIQRFRRDKLLQLRSHQLMLLNRPALEKLADRPDRSARQLPSWIAAAGS